MTHHFAAANVWLAVALTLLIGEWGSGSKCNLFGYGRIEPPLYWAAAFVALGAAVFCTHRWLRPQTTPGGADPASPAAYFALAHGWLIAGLLLLLGMQDRNSSHYMLFGSGRVEPAVYWGVLGAAVGAGGFCLLRWSRIRTIDGPPPEPMTVGRDLARVGLALFAALGMFLVVRLATDNAPRADELPLVGGAVLVYLAVTIALARKAFGSPAPAPRTDRPTARKRQAGMSGGMWGGALMVAVAAVGLLAVASVAEAHGRADGAVVWFACLLAVGLVGGMVLLVAVLTARTAPARPGPSGMGAPPDRLVDATPKVFRVMGAIGIAGIFFMAVAASSDGPGSPPAFWLLVAVGLGAVAGLLLARRPSAQPAPPADRPTCPICKRPVAPGGPAGLCPRCLIREGIPASKDGTTVGFVESYTAPAVEDVRGLFTHLTVERLIGQGGMGAVYLARQPTLDREVALKLIRRRADDPTFVERFVREARAMARLSHPSIVTVFESGEAGGLPYLVMEYVSGVTLRDAIRDKTLSPAGALSVVQQICDALEYAHRQGVVHRDIKPENILLRFDEPDGTPSQPTALPRVKIADFGLAKVAEAGAVSLTGTRQAMGTPHYMAPEQWEKPAAVDHRADIYALGVVLYELLTGELPLGRFDPPSQKIEVDVRIDEVVLRALEKEPGRRYQHAREVKTDLDHIRSGPGRPG